MEARALENGEMVEHHPGSLRAIAQARLLSASTPSGHQDAREIADRLDGKVPQAVGGTTDLPPIHTIVTGVVRAGEDGS
jgi:hypothetical protein